MPVAFVGRGGTVTKKAGFGRLHRSGAESTVSYANRVCRALPASWRRFGKSDSSADRALEPPAIGTERAEGEQHAAQKRSDGSG